MSATSMERSQAKELRASERDQQRGYSLDYKQVGLAFAIEIIVVIISLIGAWLMATKYSRTSTDFLLMMLAPVGYAIVEFSRVPLALATRTQRNPFMKVVAAFAVLCAAGVTIKSVSMLGEIMFRPRLEAVAEAKRNMDKVNHERGTIAYAIKGTDDLVEQRRSEREAAEQQLSRISTEMGKRPGQTCSRSFGTDKNGKDYGGLKCVPDPAMLALNQQRQSADENRTEASKKLEEANAKRAALSLNHADKISAEAEVSYRDALFHSQLHSFTSMVFGKDPNQVTEGEIASFLRIFVFLPAIFVALASTLLAMTAVNHIKPKKAAAPVMVPDEAVIQILKAAVLSAHEQFDEAKDTTAKTFRTKETVDHEIQTSADRPSAGVGSVMGTPTKTSESNDSKNVGADVVQLRPRMETV